MKAVGFDLDGTLIDSTDAIVASFEHTYRTMGLPLPAREAVIATIRIPLEDMFAQVGMPDIAAAVAVYREHYVREAPAITRVLPGVREVLDALRDAGVSMGIATSKKRTSAKVLLEHMDLWKYFRCCIGPEDVSRPKPDAEPIHALIACMRANPGEFVYIGDTGLDVQASRAAGVRCLAVTTGYDTRAELEAADAIDIFGGIEDAAKYVLRAGGYLS